MVTLLIQKEITLEIKQTPAPPNSSIYKTSATIGGSQH